MSEIPITAFGSEADAYDAAVATAPVADRFCTASPWVLSAFEAFSDNAEPVIHRFDEGWVPLMQVRTVLGRTWMPLEASWGLACPFVGPDPAALAKVFGDAVLTQRGRWEAIFLSGISRGGPAFRSLVHRARRHHTLGVGQPTVRCVASLDGGYDGFLSRRSSKFRKNLRRAARRAEGLLSFEVGTPDVGPEAVLDRVLTVERRSWKAREGHGIHDGPMRDFYAAMVPRLHGAGRLRVTYARHEGQDVGYVLGGVFAGGYRGLQISFDHALREHSVGNLMQRATVAALCAEGVTTYDLGTDMAYKRHWAEERVETVPLVVR